MCNRVPRKAEALYLRGLCVFVRQLLLRIALLPLTQAIPLRPCVTGSCCFVEIKVYESCWYRMVGIGWG